MSKLNITQDVDPAEIFQVLAKLGEGSYGSVYKAIDKRDQQIVAVKVLEIEDEDTTELEGEINILRNCKSEFIVQYKGSFQKDGNIWIVMEFCGAGSICDLMAICDKTLDEDQIAVIMKMSLQGLEYLHKCRKIHRDIKSGNILLTHDGDCKLADFGVSAELTNTMSKRKTVIGTPYWMAPEVLQSSNYDGKADIWSLAVWSLAITAIELAVGEPPHSEIHPMKAIFLIPNSPPPTLPEDSGKKWSADFESFLAVCLVKDQDKRPSAEELLKNHPFITKAKSKAVIAALVDECMDSIEEYRNQPDEGDEEASNYGTTVYDTMVSGGGTEQDFGTMIINSQGTMRSKGSQSDSGTMISVSVKESKEMKTTEKKTMSGAKTMSKTMHRRRESLIVAKRAANLAGDQNCFHFKMGKPLEIDESSSLLEIRNSLTNLNKAYEIEAKAMEAWYNEKRKIIQQMIEDKGR
eukprot:CAMPEP_0175175220 /NCGR_PEP_ID=MMETSP0087-20121206/33079_1 /TAXON_ID=136419 /ORGANISM="Unknown Unknown, Strain D1" /LENGTH=463 /DNA_ID=CAMNT_0016466801 /DNA_START=19 /DNA_END=1410 /DNA_ORIENTATION=-